MNTNIIFFPKICFFASCFGEELFIKVLWFCTKIIFRHKIIFKEPRFHLNGDRQEVKQWLFNTDWHQLWSLELWPWLHSVPLSRAGGRWNSQKSKHFYRDLDVNWSFSSIKQKHVLCLRHLQEENYPAFFN